MLIGIDASRATVQQRTGTEGYSYHILRGLIEQGAEHTFRLYFRDAPPVDLVPATSNVDIRVIGQKRLWTHLGWDRPFGVSARMCCSYHHMLCRGLIQEVCPRL
jgi:hypothetical protein